MQVTIVMKTHKRSWKTPNWRQTDALRQGVLATAKFNLAVAKTTLAAVREKLTAAVNLKIK